MNKKEVYAQIKKGSSRVLRCPQTSCLTAEPTLFCIIWLLPLILHFVVNERRLAIAHVFQRMRHYSSMVAVINKDKEN